jgi:hypothetical protein
LSSFHELTKIFHPRNENFFVYPIISGTPINLSFGTSFLQIRTYTWPGKDKHGKRETASSAHGYANRNVLPLFQLVRDPTCFCPSDPRILLGVWTIDIKVRPYCTLLNLGSCVFPLNPPDSRKKIFAPISLNPVILPSPVASGLRRLTSGLRRRNPLSYRGNLIHINIRPLS